MDNAGKMGRLIPAFLFYFYVPAKKEIFFLAKLNQHITLLCIELGRLQTWDGLTFLILN